MQPKYDGRYYGGGLCYLLICQRQLQEKFLWQFILVLPALVSLGVSLIISGPGTPFLAILVTLVSSYYFAKVSSSFSIR